MWWTLVVGGAFFVLFLRPRVFAGTTISHVERTALKFCPNADTR
jgi:hypothetical protein